MASLSAPPTATDSRTRYHAPTRFNFTPRDASDATPRCAARNGRMAHATQRFKVHSLRMSRGDVYKHCSLFTFNELAELSAVRTYWGRSAWCWRCSCSDRLAYYVACLLWILNSWCYEQNTNPCQSLFRFALQSRSRPHHILLRGPFCNMHKSHHCFHELLFCYVPRLEGLRPWGRDRIMLPACTNLHKQSFIIRSLFDFVYFLYLD